MRLICVTLWIIKKYFLVNLAKGRTGELNSKLLGMIFVMKFQAAAMSRSNIPEDDRVDFSLYVDEFQNFSTDSFATIMSEARKYHLNLIVANQFTTQLTQEIRDAVFGNIGTIISLRIGQNDLESLGKYFQPTFDEDDLLRLPNYNTITRTLIGGVPTQPFSMTTIPALGSPNPRLEAALKQLSAAKYGRPRAEVEKEINDRMITKADEKPAGLSNQLPTLSQTGNQLGATTNARPAPNQPSAPGTFLDEWLSKKSATPTAAQLSQPMQAAATSAPATATPTMTNSQPKFAQAGPTSSFTKPSIKTIPAAPQVPQPAKVQIEPKPSTKPELKPITEDFQDIVAKAEAAKTKLSEEELAGLPPLKKKKTEHVANIQNDEPEEGDTIFIDHDGNFRANV